MDIKKIDEGVRRAKKIKKTVDRLGIGECNVESVSAGKVTFVLSFDDDTSGRRPIGFGANM